MNSNIAPFTNQHFRLAVAYAINRDAITKGVDHGANLTQYSWYPDGILGFDPNVQHQPGVPYYNPTIAKQQLAMAMTQLKTVPAISSSSAVRTPMSLARWRRCRLSSRRSVLTSPCTRCRALPGSTTATAARPSLSGATGTTTIRIRRISPTTCSRPERARTGAAISNPAVDKLFAQANVERDSAARLKLLKQAQLIILRDAGVAPLYQFADQTLISLRSTAWS